ncbi:MAG: alpha/beta hydrolase [Rhodospirillaceae bacterium]|jgi:pimeloyl-ACP methyl ester carboxylesterase|nr:alpha/beta hydrolase [Rhodospirillaceae bacterium]
MATFVLVHGAWEAGWVWKWTVPHLRAAGHEVFAPSLTGLGERSHLMNASIDLDTHIADVLGVLEWEGLDNVTLVGHSYGGMVATGVADRANERIGSLIYLDAFLPKDGEALLDMVPPERAASMRDVADKDGDGWYLPLSAAPLQNVTDPGEAAILAEFCVSHPFATMTQKLSVSGNHLNIASKTYVLATEFQPSVFTGFAEEARQLDWRVEELATHHFTMMSMPRETADLLMRHAV